MTRQPKYPYAVSWFNADDDEWVGGAMDLQSAVSLVESGRPREAVRATVKFGRKIVYRLSF